MYRLLHPQASEREFSPFALWRKMTRSGLPPHMLAFFAPPSVPIYECSESRGTQLRPVSSFASRPLASGSTPRPFAVKVSLTRSLDQATLCAKTLLRRWPAPSAGASTRDHRLETRTSDRSPLSAEPEDNEADVVDVISPVHCRGRLGEYAFPAVPPPRMKAASSPRAC